MVIYISAQTEGEIQNLLDVNDFGARLDWQTSVRRRNKHREHKTEKNAKHKTEKNKRETNVKCASAVFFIQILNKSGYMSGDSERLFRQGAAKLIMSERTNKRI